MKLFLKGDRCLSPKCAIVKRSFPPGQKKKRRTVPLSEFGKELREKQKLRDWYNLSERQFGNYVKKILNMGSRAQNAAALLIQKLETRLDNAIFRLGFASSHAQARQMVNHGHFTLNGRPVNVPSYQLRRGDKIGFRSSSRKKKIFEKITAALKKQKIPSWLKLDPEKLEVEVMGLPTLEEASPAAEISSIFEYYSR